jgi:hypothetical protein
MRVYTLPPGVYACMFMGACIEEEKRKKRYMTIIETK